MMDKTEFDQLLNKLADEPFKYGKNDCFHFAARLVEAWHGKDFRKLHPYETKAEAEAYMKQHGGIEALTIGTLGYNIRGFPIDGDVISAEVAKGQIALGFVANGKAWFKTKKKVVAIPFNKCRKVWRIK